MNYVCTDAKIVGTDTQILITAILYRQIFTDANLRMYRHKSIDQQEIVSANFHRRNFAYVQTQMY